MSGTDRGDEGRAAQRIEILDALLECPSGERDALLARLCADDTDLRADLEARLAVEPDAYAWFDSLADRIAASTPAELAEAGREARVIGRWRTVRRIAQGGMGTVYLAERADGAFEQRVALKLIRRGMESEAAIQRFLTERRILAGVEHPNVARLLDGDLTEDGLPYLVMELVEGETLDRYCAAADPPLDRRLELFLAVADAVRHLHRHLIVHRDLKPANVLVDREGHVKIVDFGIAKALDPLADSAVAATAGAPLTPLYAAPEQLSGHPVTTATDVHALGAILYELLAGRRAFGRDGETAVEVTRAILEDDPPLPSRVAPASRARRLRGDLDAICATALRKDPAARYSSAERMIDDVLRHRAGLPLTARPPSLGYRASRFLRRHRTGAVATAALFAAAIGFGVYAATQSARIAAERDHAREVASLMVDLFSAPDPARARGADVSARDVLADGVVRIRSDLAHRPVLQAELLSVLGRSYKALGLYDEAAGIFREALAARERSLDAGHPDIGISHYDLGEALLEMADLEGARGHLDTARRIHTAHFGPEHALVADAINDLARLDVQSGALEQGADLHREALRIRRGLDPADPSAVAQSLNNLAAARMRLDDAEEAVSLLREAVEIRTSELGGNHPQTLTSAANLAAALEQVGELSEAERVARATLAGRRSVLGNDHPDVATSAANLANLLLRRGGGIAEAERLHREALAIRRAALGDDHPLVAQAIHTLGRSVRAGGRLDEAEGLFRDALARLRAALPPGHVNLAHPMIELGEILVESGRADQAVPILTEALDLRRAGLPPGHAGITEAEAALSAAAAPRP